MSRNGAQIGTTSGLSYSDTGLSPSTTYSYQLAAFESVPVITCGTYMPHAAWRSNITGLVKGSAPVFWGLEKT